MKLIVGLGNPEGRYAKTRHNAGFMVIDRLLARHAPGAVLKARFSSACAEADVAKAGKSEKCLLLKPTTYMNRSGQAVGEAFRFYKMEIASHLLVVVDELYLPVGKIRLNPSGGSAGHNGLADIDRALGFQNYPRLRVGVGLRPSGGKNPLMDQADFVLSQFAEDEWAEYEASLEKAADACEVFATQGLTAAMNQFNAPERPAREKKPNPRAGASPEAAKAVKPGEPSSGGASQT